MNSLIYLSFILLTVTKPVVFSKLIQIFIFIYFIKNTFRKNKIKKERIIYIWTSYLFLSLILKDKEIDMKDIYTCIGYCIYLLSFYYYMKSKKIEFLINQYLKLTLFFSIIALIQECGYLLKVESFYNFNNYGLAIKNSYSGLFLRVSSIFTETVHFGLFIIPAYFIYLEKKNNKIKTKIIYLLSIFLTFSLVNYFVFFIYLLTKIIFLEKKTLENIIKKMLSIIGIPFIFFILYLKISIINEKLNTLLYYKNYDIFREGGSAYSVISLMQISWSAFKNNILLGSGFLSTFENYNKYIYDYYSINKNYISQDVFYFKLLGELGLIGIVIYFILIRTFYNQNNKYSKILLIGILLINLRIGSYVFIPTLYLLALYLRIGIEGDLR